MARQYGPEAIAELARRASKVASEMARVAALNLERGYGRAVRPELFVEITAARLAPRLRVVRCRHRMAEAQRH